MTYNHLRKKDKHLRNYRKSGFFHELKEMTRRHRNEQVLNNYQTSHFFLSNRFLFRITYSFMSEQRTVIRSHPSVISDNGCCFISRGVGSDYGRWNQKSFSIAFTLPSLPVPHPSSSLFLMHRCMHGKFILACGLLLSVLLLVEGKYFSCLSSSSLFPDFSLMSTLSLTLSLSVAISISVFVSHSLFLHFLNLYSLFSPFNCSPPLPSRQISCHFLSFFTHLTLSTIR